MSVIIRTMTIADYDGVSSLWLSIKGFAIRSIDDSREGVDVFLKRNPTTSVVAEDNGVFCAGMMGEEELFTMCVLHRTTAIME